MEHKYVSFVETLKEIVILFRKARPYHDFCESIKVKNSADVAPMSRTTNFIL